MIGGIKIMAKNNSLKVLEYAEWYESKGFLNSNERRIYMKDTDMNILRSIIYPIAYDVKKVKFKTDVPFPLILPTLDKYPIYVIEKASFTLIFLSYENYKGESCWEVSMHIKDHKYCDSRIKEFNKNYYSGLSYYKKPIKMIGMPSRFTYPKLDISEESSIQDFSIEFWGEENAILLLNFVELLLSR